MTKRSEPLSKPGPFFLLWCRWLSIAGAFLIGVLSAAPAGAAGGVVNRYIDPIQQTALPFPERSHWLQPWRAYQDTPPTSRVRDAIGINLNVNPEEADAVCRHLSKNGFRFARIEFGWGSLSWDHPNQLADPARFDRIVDACRRYRLRPLFLLNAHHGAPVPMRTFRVRLRAPAHRGDRTLQLDPATTGPIVPGRSGLSRLTDYWAAEDLFTAVDAAGTAKLSRPLPKDLPAGDAEAATLKYLPFYPSLLKKDGSVPPEFTETMNGWLQYVQTIASEAKRVLGTENSADAGFDFEVWNELTFGSNFLSINNYYNPPLVEGDSPLDTILARTVAYVRDPANHLPGVGVGDGFNNQWPWGAGSTAPPGLTALDKHPYAGVRRFPQDQVPNNQRPVNALGQPKGTEIRPETWKDAFVPSYVSHFPEYFLTAIQGESLIRDLSPIPTTIGNVVHGRNTHPVWPDGRPAPAPVMWITEVNLDPNGADPGDLSAYLAGGRRPAAPGLTPADADHMKAKAILRYLVSATNKGPVRYYFFAAKDDNPMGLGLVSGSFFAAIRKNGGAYPADDGPLTSPTMLAVRRLAAMMPGGNHLAHPRSLSLVRIAETHGHVQFAGDPATAGQNPNPHPPLYNRDCLAFFPFQASDTAFVVPLYVMTRNLAHLYRPEAPATDPTRFDMPPERYTLTIGGFRGHLSNVRLTDPLTGSVLPVRLLSSAAGELKIDVPLTDSPRLLTVEE